MGVFGSSTFTRMSFTQLLWTSPASVTGFDGFLFARKFSNRARLASYPSHLSIEYRRSGPANRSSFAIGICCAMKFQSDRDRSSRFMSHRSCDEPSSVARGSVVAAHGAETTEAHG